MIAAVQRVRFKPKSVQASFLILLPQIERHARYSFRQIACPGLRGDRIAEAIGLAWKWHCRLLEQGKDVFAFPVAFSCLVAKAVKSGRRVCGQEKATDAMSSVAQHRRSFNVRNFSQSSSPEGNLLDEALRDNTQSTVPDQVAFRNDFRAGLDRLTSRNRAHRPGTRTWTHVDGSRATLWRQRRPNQANSAQFHDGWRAFGEPVRRKQLVPS
ncbi:MAG: hypothetical protein U0744_13635 [Gemmataceae bacterium]